jgi:hypothetical protein
MASRDEWYRSAAWDDDAQAFFETKLRRSRSTFHKAQYLRIKAQALIGTGDPTRIDAGCGLLRRVIADYPGETTQIALAFGLLGAVDDRRGRYVEAEAAYRESLTRRHDTQVEIALAELILTTDQRHKYAETVERLSLLFENPTALILNHTRFRCLLALARLAARLAEMDAAKQLARAALNLLSAAQPQFPRHPDVGLIDPRPETIDELQRVACGQEPLAT